MSAAALAAAPSPRCVRWTLTLARRSQDQKDVEPFALFCGEDNRFGTHLEVYPRNSGETYLL